MSKKLVNKRVEVRNTPLLRKEIRGMMKKIYGTNKIKNIWSGYMKLSDEDKRDAVNALQDMVRKGV